MDAVSRQRALAQVLLIAGCSGRAAPYTTCECIFSMQYCTRTRREGVHLLSGCALQARMALARIPVNQFFELPGRPTVVFQASKLCLLGWQFEMPRCPAKRGLSGLRRHEIMLRTKLRVEPWHAGMCRFCSKPSSRDRLALGIPARTLYVGACHAFQSCHRCSQFQVISPRCAGTTSAARDKASRGAASRYHS